MKTIQTLSGQVQEQINRKEEEKQQQELEEEMRQQALDEEKKQWVESVINKHETMS